MTICIYDSTWTGTATTASSTDTVWVRWTTDSTSTGSVTTDNTWAVWIDGTDKIKLNQAAIKYTSPAPPTPEELEAQRLQQEELRKEAERRAQERDEAIARARALLMSCLGPKQKRDYKQKECFTVRSQSGKRYRLGKGLPKEIDKEGKAINAYCIHPVPSIPDGDKLLTEMLMLRYDETEFLRIANKVNPN